jgi:hypothetical protein
VICADKKGMVRRRSVVRMRVLCAWFCIAVVWEGV